MIKLVRLILTWIRRLPWKFTIPFLVILAGWLFLVAFTFQKFQVSEITDLLAKLVGIQLPGKQEITGFAYHKILIRVLFESLVTLIILFLAFLTSYNLAALVYRLIRRHPPGKAYVHPPVLPEPGSGDVFEQFKKRNGIKDLRIGLILAGGGAKGAYQAGAMKGIHEFLEKSNVLDKVRMVAGTSIGSWNSLFWLAGLVKSPKGSPMSVHEAWWGHISVDRIMEFAAYFPLKRNYFLTTRPWQENFDDIFQKEKAIKDAIDRLFVPKGNNPPMHFYLTRSNVELGILEFATNNTALVDMKRLNWKSKIEEPVIPSDRYELIDSKTANPLERLKIAVFASMDLPPLFPYMRIRTDREEWFEDGGVVDNLPMRFGTEIEECNLLFVLPLNASFAEQVGHDSVTKRLFRVMDIRQGVLEHNSIKLARLYNDKTRLRNQISEQEHHPANAEKKPLLSVFAICPEQPLAINTAEFWKPKEALEAFDLMYSATRTALNDSFLELSDPDCLMMTLVGPQGQTTILDDF
jgi:predicted acylesterase/phospholipase RssA